MSESEQKPRADVRSNAEWLAQWAIDVEQDPYDLPLASLNPAHSDLFQANRALPYFERLRAEDPVHYCADSQFGPYWSITRYDDIKYVDCHEQIFSSDIMNGGIRLGGRPRPEGEEPDPMFHLPMFIMQDPPKHDEQRKVVAPKFSGRSLAGFEPLIRERAGRILDGLPRGEEFNWVRAVSVELTGQMLATIFDVPQADRHLLIHWSDTVERLGDPDYFETPAEGFRELWKCFEYFDAVWKERVKNPGDDLISMLAHGESTRNMSPNEYLGNMLLLIVGGNDTTRNSISGGVLALNQFPDEYAKLEQDPALVPNMVAEIIRWQSPVAHMCRTAMEDTEIRGRRIARHDKVCMWYLSGNRDEDVFPDGNAFRIDRANARQHTSFGFGIHRCLGNRLGEMQLKIIWEEIMKRFARVEVVGEPQYLRSSFIRGITDLPVRLHER